MELDKKNIDKNFPFQAYRKYQKESIKDIIDAINSGYENIFLSADVGFGKSSVAITLANMLNEENEESYILTKTNQLQKQYLKEFPHIKTAMGRRNFTCKDDSQHNDCSQGTCQIIKHNCSYGVSFDTGYPIFKKDSNSAVINDESIDVCNYWRQKITAMLNPISILNYKYALIDFNFINHFHARKLGVFDEAHGIESEVMNHLELKIIFNRIKREAGYEVSIQDNIDDWIWELGYIRDAYIEALDNVTEWKKKDEMSKHLQQIKVTMSHLTDEPDNWIFQNEHKYCVFKPIKVHNHVQDILFKKTDINLLMSGTILRPQWFAEWLGIEEYKEIDVPYIIEPKQRPIYKRYAGSMSSSQINNNISNVVKEILTITEEHKNEKGIVHTHTYNISSRLSQLLPKHKFLFHTSNKEDREETIEFFKEADEPMVLVSPYAFEGVDFPDNQARWQILLKDPFPNIGDRQIKARDQIDRKLSGDSRWLYYDRCLKLSQAYGRIVRGPNDYGTTYILDSQINNLLGPSSLLSDYFWSGVQDETNKEFKIINKNKLSPDKRKSYQEERDNEEIILEAIEEENLNTANKVRKEYKKLDSDSYKVIIPTINNLIKNGALEYI